MVVMIATDVRRRLAAIRQMMANPRRIPPFARVAFTGGSRGCVAGRSQRRNVGDVAAGPRSGRGWPKPPRPGRAAPASRRGHGGRRLAAIRQVCPMAAHATKGPGVATRARGDDGDDRRCGEVAQPRSGRCAPSPPTQRNAPASRRGHGRSAAGRDPAGAGQRYNAPASRRGHGAMLVAIAAWPRSGRCWPTTPQPGSSGTRPAASAQRSRKRRPRAGPGRIGRSSRCP